MQVLPMGKNHHLGWLLLVLNRYNIPPHNPRAERVLGVCPSSIKFAKRYICGIATGKIP